MDFICPKCKHSDLSIQKSLDLGSDDYDDEVTIQTIACSNCGFRGIATYRESRRGGGESWQHFGFDVGLEVYNQVQLAIAEKATIVPSDFYNENHVMFPMKIAR